MTRVAISAVLSSLLILAAGPASADETVPGSVVGWGGNVYGQCNVPPPNADFVMIDAINWHSLGLKSDGTIVYWGAGYSWNVPAPSPEYVAVTCGIGVDFALTRQGQIVVWGDNDPHYNNNPPAPNSGYLAVRSGYSGNHFGIRPGGVLVHWGTGHGGQDEIPAPNRDFIDVRSGHGHATGLKADGTVVTWGSDEFYWPIPMPGPNAGFVAIAVGPHNSLALRSDGTIAAWGSNWYGECNVPAPNADFVAIAAGIGVSLGLKSDGTVVSWGVPSAQQAQVPPPNPRYIALAVGNTHALALTSDEPLPLACRIDVVPHNDRNHIDCRGRERLIPVAILSDADFDARQVDPATVRFGPADAEDARRPRRGVGRRHEVDIDHDGDIDMLFHFRFADTGLRCGDSRAEIHGALLGGRIFIGSDAVDVGSRGGPDDGGPLPLAASPNPFNPRTTIRFELLQDGPVRLDVFDLAGRLVATLVDEGMSQGSHEVEWDGRDASGREVGSGFFLGRLESGGMVESVRLGLVR